MLSRNIANSDTPDYRPRDLKPFNFRNLLRSQAHQVKMSVTDKSHITGGRSSRDSEFSVTVDRKPYGRRRPAGTPSSSKNRMAKVNQTNIAHRLTTSLYTKHLDMVKIALGKGR